jgi:hypothetical protein
MRPMHLVAFGMQNRTFGPFWQPLIGSSLWVRRTGSLTSRATVCGTVGGMWILCMAAKQGPNVLSCMPSRTGSMLLVSAMGELLGGRLTGRC